MTISISMHFSQVNRFIGAQFDIIPVLGVIINQPSGH